MVLTYSKFEFWIIPQSDLYPTLSMAEKIQRLKQGSDFKDRLQGSCFHQQAYTTFLLIIPTSIPLVELVLSQHCLKNTADHNCFLLPITLHFVK